MLALLQPSGIEFILALQAHANAFLNGFFYLISQLGGTGLLFIVPLLIWCIEPRLGLRALLALLIVQFFIIAIKDSVQELRPFMVDPRIVSQGDHGYSFPSGHAVRSMVFYGLVALSIDKKWSDYKWLKWLLAALIIFIGLSRIYFGVHYPHDVIAGLLIGIIFLWAWLQLATPVAHFFNRCHPLLQGSIAFIIPALIATAYYAMFGYTAAPLVAGGLSATVFSITVERDTKLINKQREQATYLQKALHYCIGMIVLALVVFGELVLFKMARQYEDMLLINATLWLSGFMAVWIVGYFVPRLFSKLHHTL